MLVSAISSFRAIAMQNNAAMAMMSANNAAINSVRSIRANDTNFNALHQQDVRNSINMANNQFKHQVASAWKKQCHAQLKKEMDQQKRLNVIA